jgi:PPK2 family polyphosphate:nucleotide phosphotransferase
MVTRMEKILKSILVRPGTGINLRKDFDPAYTGHFTGKEHARKTLAEGIRLLSEQQDMLYAQDTFALLIIFQALDAAGKDGTIKHVMSGVNPQGVQVTSFKTPSVEELNHDYLWRCTKALPERGRIGIFNRSYYEEVLAVRIHPELLSNQHIPPDLNDKNIWDRRFEEINNFEKYLTNNGILILKFFLNVSKDEQKRRFLERVEEPEKNWKFSAADIRERGYWDHYMDAYEEVLNNTSTRWAPWYVVPADHKWFTRLAVSTVIHSTLDKLKLAYPKVSKEQKQALLEAKAEMMQENTHPDHQ